MRAQDCEDQAFPQWYERNGRCIACHESGNRNESSTLAKTATGPEGRCRTEAESNQRCAERQLIRPAQARVSLDLGTSVTAAPPDDRQQVRSRSLMYNTMAFLEIAPFAVGRVDGVQVAGRGYDLRHGQARAEAFRNVRQRSVRGNLD